MNSRRLQYEPSLVTDEMWRTLTNQEIAQRIGASAGTVGKWRRKYTTIPSPVTRALNLLTTVAEETWRTRADTEIAELLGITQTSVQSYRHTHVGITSPYLVTQRLVRQRAVRQLEQVSDEKWRSRTNKEIAAELGVASHVVDAFRRASRSELPSPVTKAATMAALSTISDEMWRTLTDTEIGEQIGKSTTAVGRYRTRFTKYASPVTDAATHALLSGISDDDWQQLSNKVIGNRVGRSSTVVGRYRATHEKPVSVMMSITSANREHLASLSDAQWRSLSDAEVAKDIGIHQSSVAKYRRKHGKPLSPSVAETRRRWNSVAPEAWSTSSNVQIADLVGVSAGSVARYRRIHELPALQDVVLEGLRSVPPETWRTSTDRRIAEQIGCSATAVGRYRQDTVRIPSPVVVSRVSRFDPLKNVSEEVWRTHTNTEIGKELGIRKGLVDEYRRKHISIPSPKFARTVLASVTQEMWRTMTDKEIAKCVGRSATTVSCYRRQTGILSPVTASLKTRDAKLMSVTDQMWGTMTDRRIAALVGLGVEVVGRYRNKAVGIPSPEKTSKWSKFRLLGLLQSIRPHLSSLDEQSLFAILQQGAMSRFCVILDAVSPLAVLKDLRENGGRALEQALTARPDDNDFDVDETDIPSCALSDLVDDQSEVDIEKTLHAADTAAALPGGIDSETADFLVINQVNRLWQLCLNDSKTAAHGVLPEGEGAYYTEIRQKFLDQLESAESLIIPSGWSAPFEPLLMQRYVASQVRDRHRFGNWSDTGAGKTHAAILSSRVVDARVTVIVANNATLTRNKDHGGEDQGDDEEQDDGWRGKIQMTYPDSLIYSFDELPATLDRNRHNYILVNYEKFQGARRTERVERLLALKPDFIVLDEIQLAKQRDDKIVSQRRRTLEAFVAQAATANKNIYVLGMSATPVVNNLLEARKLLEIVTGKGFPDLATKPTLHNAFAVHRALMLNGFRHQPRYAQTCAEVILPSVRSDLVSSLRGLTKREPLPYEQAFIQARLEAAESYFRRGTVVYTQYKEGILRTIRRYLEVRGFSVGVYSGDDKSGLKPFKKRKRDILILTSCGAEGVFSGGV